MYALCAGRGLHRSPQLVVAPPVARPGEATRQATATTIPVSGEDSRTAGRVSSILGARLYAREEGGGALQNLVSISRVRLARPQPHGSYRPLVARQALSVALSRHRACRSQRCRHVPRRLTSRSAAALPRASVSPAAGPVRDSTTSGTRVRRSARGIQDSSLGDIVASG